MIICWINSLNKKSLIKDQSLLDDGNDDMFNDRDDMNHSPSLLDADKDDMLDDKEDGNHSPSLLDHKDDVEDVDQSLLDDGEDDLFNELDDSGNNGTGDSHVNSDNNKHIEVKEKADSDDFASLNLEPPTNKETAFLSANFGHSR